ncbi:Rieske (2Fe-2S) protein [Amycolatopsis sp. GM8]|uniref:Rieske (2Fe-2S) protein n=1 Tax=Amycolatopsis sp. GM8 TaxID=2896530 RepID=UPI001F47DCD4|nr:Rieske 2Fe-2S domain-containing protein [Amycolatopsis sp. GM8]
MNDAPATTAWRPALAEAELWEGDMTPVVVGGTSVLLLNVDGEVRAYLNRCPHQEWALDEGEFEDGTLTCSRHLWEFDARSGGGINPADCALVSYRAKVEGGTIWVAVT